MKVLIHGATNGSNFGDCLFAHLFYEELSENHQVDFVKMPHFGMGQYLADEIQSYSPQNINLCNADCLVYMSGGYFGDTNGTLSESIVRFVRYFLIAIPFIIRNKPIYICGVGGGPIRNNVLKKTIVFIMNKAQFISVRDTETSDYFSSIGVRTPIYTTADSALSIYKREMIQLPQDLVDKLKEKKNIFSHVYGSDNSNTEIEEKILPALNKFVGDDLGKYRVFVGTDNKCRTKVENLRVFKELVADKCAIDYPGTWMMCSLLSNMDVVLTVKLHVGIISSLFGKSVISLPKHKTKTKRFYNQIGCSERCVQLSDANPNIIYNMLKSYSSEPILVENRLKELAKKNLDPFNFHC